MYTLCSQSRSCVLALDRQSITLWDGNVLEVLVANYKSNCLFYVLASSLMAPQLLPAQNCEAVLGYIRDTTQYSLAQGSSYSFKRFFCDQTFSSYQQAEDAGLKLGIVLDDLPVSIDGHDRSSSFSQYQHSLCENIDTQSSSYLAIHSKVVAANDGVVKAWTECISQPGVHFWAEANNTDPSLVTFVATYNGLQNVYEAQVKGPLEWTPHTALNCREVQIGKLRDNAYHYINNQRSVETCTRNGQNGELPAGTVNIKTAADDRTVQLPAYSPPPVINDVPTTLSKHCPISDTDLQRSNDGILGPGTTHRYSVPCDTDGYIIDYSAHCVGPCDHAYRDASIALQDAFSNNHHSVFAKYYIDDTQATRSFYIDATYQVNKRVCVAHCNNVSPGVINSGSPLTLQ